MTQSIDLAFIVFFVAELGLHVSISQEVPAFALIVPGLGARSQIPSPYLSASGVR
jgi:hypothetical protein